jgi:hypothetical protein
MGPIFGNRALLLTDRRSYESNRPAMPKGTRVAPRLSSETAMIPAAMSHIPVVISLAFACLRGLTCYRAVQDVLDRHRVQTPPRGVGIHNAGDPAYGSLTDAASLRSLKLLPEIQLNEP